MAKFNANKPGKGPRQVLLALGYHLLGDANPPGLLRTLVYPRPIDVIQLPDRIVQLFDTRISGARSGPMGARFRRPRAQLVWLPRRQVEGDTLVVQTVGLDARAWLDEWGTPFSEEAKITERWRKVDAKTIQMTVTVDDPPTFAKPWTSDPRTLRIQPKTSPNGEVLEVIFAPMDEKEFNERVRDPAGGRVN